MIHAQSSAQVQCYCFITLQFAYDIFLQSLRPLAGLATAATHGQGAGLPISTTHTLVGAVLGVGIARGIAALNMHVVRTIFMSWIVTLPAGAILAIFFFYIFKAIFG